MLIVKILPLLMFSGILMGAFGAHALKGRLSPEMMSAYHTGVLYHLVGVAALLGLRFEERGASARTGGRLVVWGIVVFSGSLYALACTGVRVLGAITPLGGLMMMAGWLFIFADNHKSDAAKNKGRL